MKEIVGLSLIISLIFVGCDKSKSSAESTEKITVNNEATFQVDSINVKDSLKVDKNLTVVFESKILVFPTLKNKPLLDSIYAPKQIQLSDYSKANLAEAINKKKSEYYEEQKSSLKDYKPEFAQSWFIHSDMKMFSKDNNFLTVQYTGDGYTGGAHGYYYENYKVFDLKTNKTMQLADLIADPEAAIWQKILMDNFIQNDGDKGQVDMLLVDQIPLNSNFYFDKEHLYFLYNQYEITAYAAGPVLIKIPLADIKLLLTDDFIKRQSL